MKELTVQTSGNFMLLDRFSGREIPAAGSATVPHTPFIQERLDNGDLELLDGELPEREKEAPAEPETETELPERENETETETITEGAVKAETKPAKRGRNR